jgi:hypothetical protein
VVCCEPLQGFHRQAAYQLSVTVIKSRRFLTKAESGSAFIGKADSKPLVGRPSRTNIPSIG